MIDRIGTYRVEGEIGRGGMGVVYRALDERLDRDVAIKALPEELAEDPARLERFEREARALASLNHPNIGAIYGVEEVDGARYLVLEYVEGETLADVLDRGPIDIDDAIDIGSQMGEGIEAAHNAGIIHRDLKPANIKITPDGKVKVLDFGLAKEDEGATTQSGISQAATLTTPAVTPTVAGVILGTAAYMSPEQARGRRVDKRTDIWSFGVILYEMLIGASPFVGETVSDSIGAVLHKTIELDRLPADTPAGVKRVLTRCVERDKNQRYRDIGDVRLELLRAKDEPAPIESAQASGRRPLVLAAVLVLIAAFAAAGWFGKTLLEPAETRNVRKFDLMRGSVESPLDVDMPRISPDGARVAFIRDGVVHLRDLSSFDAQPLPGTDGAKSVFWSPDSKWIGYLTDRAVYKVALRGGGATKVADAESTLMMLAGGGWTADDRIIYREDDHLAQVTVRGGEPTSLIGVDDETEIDFHEPSVIAGTNIVLFIRHMRNGAMTIVANDGERETTLASYADEPVSVPRYSPTGHVLFVRGYRPQNLWAIGFDTDAMAVTSEPFLVMPEAAEPSVADDGTLVTRRGSPDMTGQLVWATPDAGVTPIGYPFDMVINPVLSPDETKIALTTGVPPKFDAWVLDLERGSRSRLTFEEAYALVVGWSLDGAQIAVIHYDPSTGDSPRTRFYAADASGETREPIEMAVSSLDAEWTVGVGAIDPMSADTDIRALSLDNPTESTTLIKSEHVRGIMSLNPAGSLAAYVSNESGNRNVYCTRFPDGSGKWQVSTEGGYNPIWSRDGGTLYFQHDDGLYAVAATTDPSVQFGMPELVLDAKAAGVDLGSGWYPTSDPERFLSLQADAESEADSAISVIENWYEEYRER